MRLLPTYTFIIITFLNRLWLACSEIYETLTQSY